MYILFTIVNSGSTSYDMLSNVYNYDSFQQLFSFYWYTLYKPKIYVLFFLQSKITSKKFIQKPVMISF